MAVAVNVAAMIVSTLGASVALIIVNATAVIISQVVCISFFDGDRPRGSMLLLS